MNSENPKVDENKEHLLNPLVPKKDHTVLELQSAITFLQIIRWGRADMRWKALYLVLLMWYFLRVFDESALSKIHVRSFKIIFYIIINRFIFLQLVFSHVRALEASRTCILQFPINSFHGYIFCGCLLTQHADFGS